MAENLPPENQPPVEREITPIVEREGYKDWNVVGNVMFPDTDYSEIEVRSEEEWQTVPPGQNFIQMMPNSENFGKRMQRIEGSPPTLTLGNPSDDMVLIDLPDNAFYYTLDSEGATTLKQKKAEDPSIYDRAFDRLWGLDVDPRSLRVEVPRIISTVGLAMAGGQLGSKIPTAPGPAGVVINPFTGAIALSALGSMYGAIAPEQGMELMESIGIAPEGWREKYGYSDEELRTLFINEGVLDLAFSGVFSTGRALGRPATRAFAHITKEGKELAKQAHKMGVAMLPVQLGDRGIARSFVPVLGRFPLWGAPFKVHGELAQKKYLEFVAELPERFHNVTGLDALSLDIMSGATRVLKDFGDDFGRRYDDIFAQAKQLDVNVIPHNTVEEAERIANEIRSSVRKNPTTGATSTLSPPQEQFLKIVDEILALQTKPVRTGAKPTLVTEPGRGIAGTRAVYPTRQTMMDTGEVLNAYPQTLESMDSLLSELDTSLSAIKTTLGGKLPSNLGKYYADLTNKIKLDVVGNVAQRQIGPDGVEVFARNDATQNLGRELRELDTEFAYVMQSIYDTSAAKMFGSVRRGGLRGVVAPSQEQLRKSVATLAKQYIDLLPQNPDAVYDLARMLPRDTFQQFKANYLNEVLQRSLGGKTAGSEGILNMQKLRDNLGLANNSGSQMGRRNALETLFKVDRAGLKMEAVNDILTMPEMAKILEVGEVISEIDIPNASVFIQRRLTLGGPQAVVGSVFPGAAVGTAIGSSKWGIGRLMAALGVIGGVRLISSSLANPATALPFMRVIGTEASNLQRKQNFVRIVRAAARGTSAAVVGGSEALIDRAEEFLDAYEEDVDIANPPQAVLDLEAQYPVLTPNEIVDETVAVTEAPPPPLTETVPRPAAQFTDPNLLAATQQIPATAPPAGGGVDSAMRERYAALYPNDMVSTLIDQGVGSLPA